MDGNTPKLALSWVCVIAAAVDFIVRPVAAAITPLMPWPPLATDALCFIGLVVGVRAVERIINK